MFCCLLDPVLEPLVVVRSSPMALKLSACKVDRMEGVWACADGFARPTFQSLCDSSDAWWKLTLGVT